METIKANTKRGKRLLPKGKRLLPKGKRRLAACQGSSTLVQSIVFKRNLRCSAIVQSPAESSLFKRRDASSPLSPPTAHSQIPYRASSNLIGTRPARPSRVERDAPRRVRPPPHRTVRAVFPHTALRVEVCIHRSRSPNLFSIVSLWSRRHRSTWTSGLRLAASSADCPL